MGVPLYREARGGERGWVGASGGLEGARVRANFNMGGGREGARGGERGREVARGRERGREGARGGKRGARGGREGDRRSEEK